MTTIQHPETHRLVLLVALAIGLGITVHEVFFVVAQVVALVACVHVMVGAIRTRRGHAALTPQHP